MNRRTVLPLLWPLALLVLGQLNNGFLQRVRDYRDGRELLESRRRHLDELRAQAVAGRLEGREYQALLKEFAALTSLQASDPFRDPQAAPLGTGQVASLVNGLQAALAEPVEEGGAEPLQFLSVSPGQQQRIGPFIMVEFGLNLRGRFRALPSFLRLMTRLAHHRRLAISIGRLHLDSTYLDPVTGEGLAITLPIRTYFRE